MSEAKDIDYVLAVPTFVGSLLSFLGSATAIGFQIARPPQRHFRHSLIVNLLIADLIYGLGNTISGAIFLAKGKTPSPFATPDTACRVSGFFSQANAQHIDFIILSISIVVLLSVIRKDSIAQLDLKWQILICMAAWVPGIITGTVGLALNSYGYTGNWCWVRPDRLDLRYGLSHGPRIAIFAITIGIYTYIYITLKRTFRDLRSFSTNVTDTRTMQDHQGAPADGHTDNDTQKILINQSVSVSHELHDLPRTPDTANSPRDHDFGAENNHSTHAVTISGDLGTQTSDAREFKSSRMPAPPNLKKMLLMNGYPLAYIILWIPGIANRLAESVGGAPRWLTALQASTQYIGLINAVTYGMSEQLRRGVWRKLKDSGRGS